MTRIESADALVDGDYYWVKFNGKWIISEVHSHLSGNKVLSGFGMACEVFKSPEMFVVVHCPSPEETGT